MAEPSMRQAAFDWSPDRSPESTPRSPARPREPRRGGSTTSGGTAAAPPVDAEERGLRWITADEATAHLGFPSRKALYAAVERGQVPAHKLGRRLRFRRAELDALLDRGR